MRKKFKLFATVLGYGSIAAVIGGLVFALVSGQRDYGYMVMAQAQTGESAKEDYIHWVEFTPSLAILEQALQYDIQSHGAEIEMDWIELLAYAAAKCGGAFKAESNKNIDELVKRLNEGERMEDITSQLRYYAYYKEAYQAVLSEFVGEYHVKGEDQPRYGLKVYSPIAKEYGFGHCDDFGNARSYGYQRLHLGNDLSGSIGTPIIAVEGGKITALGWNRYGGWRVGIRSHDGLRYYYYAHMRKDHPYVKTRKLGDTVQAGDVIGYMGMTGYSIKENVNNIHVPHLHFGMQLIFDESQAEGPNQIWIDVYQIVRLLQRNRMLTVKDEASGEHIRTDGGAV